MEQQTISREFTFPGNSESMVDARESIMDFIKKNGASEGEEIDIFVALQEALANAVLHGCQNDGAKTVRCCIKIDPSAFVIVIRDPGPGFDLAATQTAGPRLNTTEHGRGICLMRSLMNDISYGHGGSEVRLRKLRGR
ncbi:MAG: ATP-binding protein [Candidatus Korobacteraceae bacterium]|jgi:serine/threonine-protein kinase RsbW